MLSFPAVVLSCSLLLGGTPAAWSATVSAPSKIFVASYGSDANAGTTTSPKRTFQAAHDAVAANGQIVVLDTAGYGALSISKAVSITVPPGVNGFVTVPLGATEAIRINVPSALPLPIVSLQGLIIEGGGDNSTQTTGTNYGIHQVSGGNLIIEDCTIRNFYDAVYIDHAGKSVLVSHCRILNSYYGLDVERVEDVVVADCTFYANQYALYVADASAGLTRAEVTHSIFQYNTYAFQGAGSVIAELGNSTLGVFGQLMSTVGITEGGWFTYGNNQGSTDHFTSTVPLH